MTYNIKYACVCNIGKRRRDNQDNYICNGRYRSNEDTNLEPPIIGVMTSKEPELTGIFDGMGGEACGEMASILAAQEAASLKLTENPVGDLLRLCDKANSSICDYAEENRISSMGTTAALIIFGKKEVNICNIGDSKIYLCSDSEFLQLSEDHVLKMFAEKKPPLSQNLGIPPEEMVIEPYVAQYEYKDGDCYIIASDGLTDMVTEERIAEIVRSCEPEKSVELLLQEALDNGGRDNITAIVCKVIKKGWFFL